MPGQQIDEMTFFLGIEMLHDQQRQAVQRIKQCAHRLQAAGRCADSDDGIIGLLLQHAAAPRPASISTYNGYRFGTMPRPLRLQAAGR